MSDTQVIDELIFKIERLEADNAHLRGTLKLLQDANETLRENKTKKSMVYTENKTTVHDRFNSSYAPHHIHQAIVEADHLRKSELHGGEYNAYQSMAQSLLAIAMLLDKMNRRME